MNTETKEEGAMLQLEAQRVIAAAKDAMTDEMVGRIAGSAADALDMMDQVGRSGLSKAIPKLAEMVNNGDLDRLAQMARVYHAAQDALTDEMVGRLAGTMGEGMLLLDRVQRSGFIRLVEVLERMEANGELERLATALPVLLNRLEMISGLFACLETAASKSKEMPASGGIGSLWRIMTDEETVRSLQFLLQASQQMQENCAAKR